MHRYIDRFSHALLCVAFCCPRVMKYSCKVCHVLA
nr:MAG TPA: conotoxin [Caudoviricetes sp.]